MTCPKCGLRMTVHQAEAECICGCTVYAREGVSLEQAREEKAAFYARQTAEMEQKSASFALKMERNRPKIDKKEENGVKSTTNPAPVVEEKPVVIAPVLEREEAKIDQLKKLLDSFGMDDLMDLPYPIICAMRRLKKALDK